MGCDIHGFIEFRHPQSQGKDWDAFGGQLSLDRNYRIFGLLAGVRGGQAVHPPKGIPRDIDHSYTIDRYTLYVSVDSPDEEGSTTPERAASYVRGGSSDWWDADHRRVTHPDWHTPSWLTTSEYADVLRAYQDQRPEWEQQAEREIDQIRRTQPGLFDSFYKRYVPGQVHPLPVCYAAILGAMCAAEEAGYPARFVFWFDN